MGILVSLFVSGLWTWISYKQKTHYTYLHLTTEITCIKKILLFTQFWVGFLLLHSYLTTYTGYTFQQQQNWQLFVQGAPNGFLHTLYSENYVIFLVYYMVFYGMVVYLESFMERVKTARWAVVWFIVFSVSLVVVVGYFVVFFVPGCWYIKKSVYRRRVFVGLGLLWPSMVVFLMVLETIMVLVFMDLLIIKRKKKQ